MVSKRERKKQEKRWFRFLEEHAEAMTFRVTSLMIEEMLFERRMRRKNIRMARRRDPGAYIK